MKIAKWGGSVLELNSTEVIDRGYRELARRSLTAGDLEKAKDLCIEGLETAVGDEAGQLCLLLGYIHHQSSQPENAIAACQRAIRLGVEDWSNYFFLGVALRDLGKLEASQAALERAHELSPSSVDAASALLESTATIHGIPAAREMFERMAAAHQDSSFSIVWPSLFGIMARRSIATADFVAAETHCLEGLEAGDSGELHFLLGYIGQQNGQHEKSVASCRRAIELGVEDWSNYLSLGISLRELGRLDEAEEAIKQTFELAPSRIDAASALLEVTAILHGMPTAWELLQGMSEIRLHPSFAKIWPGVFSALARRRLADDDIEAARQLCLEGLKAGELSELYLLLGTIHQQANEHDRTADCCQKAIDLGTDDWSNYYVLGSALRALDRREEARVALAQAHRMAPKRVDVAAQLIEVTLATKGFEAGRALYVKMKAALGPSDIDVFWTRAVASFLPPSADELIEAGAIAEVERSCAEAAEFGSRRAALWCGYLKRYRDWLKFTSQQHDRSDPKRKPTMTVFLITYNHGKYVAEALDGILMQESDFDINVHAIDDASTDNTQEVILDYQQRHPGVIKTFFNPTNIGTLDPPQQKVTYNGYKTIKSDYFAILEGDDYWTASDKVQKQVSFLERHPQYVGVAHNTVKIYEGKEQEPHRFLYWSSHKRTYTIDDTTEMNLIFHASSIVYRNVFLGEPPRSFRSKWSCDIFWPAAHLQFGELYHMDEDMSVHRAHAGGLYSTMSALRSRVFTISGLLRYNLFLKCRFLKQYAFSLNRLTLGLMQESRAGELPKLRPMDMAKYMLFASIGGWIYDFLDRFPNLDPAVFYYKEPPKPSQPRLARLVEFHLR